MLEVRARDAGSPPQMRVRRHRRVDRRARRWPGAATYSGRTVDLAEPDGRRALARRAEPDGAYCVRDEVRVDGRVPRTTTSSPTRRRSHAGALDLVVCRNVTIYFARETTRALVDRFHDVLRPGGWLLLGHAETLWQVSDDVRAAGRSARRSPTGPRRVAARSPPRRAVRAARRRHVAAPLLPAACRVAAPGADRPAQPHRRAAVPAARPAAAAARAACRRRGWQRRPPAPHVRCGRGPRSTPVRTTRPRGSRSAALERRPRSSAEAYLLLGHARLNLGDAARGRGAAARPCTSTRWPATRTSCSPVALSSAGRAAQAAPAYRAAANTLPGVPAETRAPDAGRTRVCRSWCSCAAGWPMMQTRGADADPEGCVSGYLTFVMGGRDLAAPLDQVREIVRAVGVEPLPGVRAPVTGLIELRGDPLPVVDLRMEADAGGARRRGRDGSRRPRGRSASPSTGWWRWSSADASSTDTAPRRSGFRAYVSRCCARADDATPGAAGRPAPARRPRAVAAAPR